MITPQTTIQELQAVLRVAQARSFSVAYSSRMCSVSLNMPNRSANGCGPDLVSAINDALEKAKQ